MYSAPAQYPIQPSPVQSMNKGAVKRMLSPVDVLRESTEVIEAASVLTLYARLLR
jgi:hypothetical protein